MCYGQMRGPETRRELWNRSSPPRQEALAVHWGIPDPHIRGHDSGQPQHMGSNPNLSGSAGGDNLGHAEPQPSRPASEAVPSNLKLGLKPTTKMGKYLTKRTGPLRRVQDEKFRGVI